MVRPIIFALYIHLNDGFSIQKVEPAAKCCPQSDYTIYHSTDMHLRAPYQLCPEPLCSPSTLQPNGESHRDNEYIKVTRSPVGNGWTLQNREILTMALF